MREETFLAERGAAVAVEAEVEFEVVEAVEIFRASVLLVEFAAEGGPRIEALKFPDAVLAAGGGLWFLDLTGESSAIADTGLSGNSPAALALRCSAMTSLKVFLLAAPEALPAAAARPPPPPPAIEAEGPDWEVYSAACGFPASFSKAALDLGSRLPIIAVARSDQVLAKSQ